MQKTVYSCDKCGKEIKDVVYTITCYAKDLDVGPLGGVSSEVMLQNARQNLGPAAAKERHLCRVCKDKITDGIFVV